MFHTPQPVAVPSIHPAAVRAGSRSEMPEERLRDDLAARRESPLFPRGHTKALGVKGGREERRIMDTEGSPDRDNSLYFRESVRKPIFSSFFTFMGFYFPSSASYLRVFLVV